MRLKNKIAIITGGARGIGLAVARTFAREGAAVVIADVNFDSAQTSASSITASGGRALPVAVNVADPVSINAMIATVLKDYGRIDLLVNNAGVGGNTPFLLTSLDDWNRIISINLTGAFLVVSLSRI